MRKWIELYPNAKELYNTLLKAKTVGSKNRGKDRAALITPLLNAIVEQECDWNPQQCASCYKRILEKYVNDYDNLNLLLAVSGYSDEFCQLKNASQRRQSLSESLHITVKALEKRENAALMQVAASMHDDYGSDRHSLLHIISEALSIQELANLQLEQLVLSHRQEALTNENPNYKVNGKISNIGLTRDDSFVGRKSILDALQEGFESGYHVQIIGGSDGIGKSRAALEYARIHADKYQIVCLIHYGNMYGNIIDFFKSAKIAIDDSSRDNIISGFQTFLDNNTNWLVILDDFEIIYSSQINLLKSLLPHQKGNAIITGNSGSNPFDGAAFYLLNDVIESHEHDDGVLFVRNTLGASVSAEQADELVSLCYNDMTTLAIATSFIHESKWLDCGIYLKMLKSYNDKCEKTRLPTSSIAFNILMNYSIGIGKKLPEESAINIATEQVLIIAAIPYRLSLDLVFYSLVFPIFPEPLLTVCLDENSRLNLIKKLKSFGFYEINDGVLRCNTWLTTLCRDYFSPNDLNSTCIEILSGTEKALSYVAQNAYVNNKSSIIANAEQLARSAYNRAIVFNAISISDAKNTYPNTSRLYDSYLSLGRFDLF